MSVIRQILVLALIAGLAGGTWYALGPLLGQADTGEGAGSRGGARASSVVVAPVASGVERVRVEAVGTARARASAFLHPAAAGEITAINFTADAEVSRGDVLLELDRDAETLAVDLARVRLEDAQRIFNRLNRLSASGATSQASLDDARTTLQAARIELKRAEVELEDRFVLAPFDGRIGLTDLDVGDRIDSSTEIATLDDRAVLLVRFEVPEALLGRVRTGNPVRVRPWSAGSGEIAGRIVDVGSRVSEDTRTFTVRAQIQNADDALRPGMSFRVTLDVEGREYPRIPEVAIQWGGEGSFVWAIRDAKATRIPVTIVQRQEARVLVSGDLRPDDRVVIEGLHHMRQGVPVNIIDPAEDPAVPARVDGAAS